MKSLWFFLLFLSGLQSGSNLLAKTVYEQLKELNTHWRYRAWDTSLLKKEHKFEGDRELIVLHLSLVEHKLRQSDVSHLSAQQLLRRMHCLEILSDYRSAGIFPKNSFHAQRTPYFIDQAGTYCAVGFLLKETGFGSVAQQIYRENNYRFVPELDSLYPALRQWSSAYGFTVDELAWIQPTYGNNNYLCYSPTYSTQVQVVNSTCPGNCNGNILLPTHNPWTLQPIVAANINPIAVCNAICPGTYTVVATDIMANTVFFSVTVGSNNQFSATGAEIDVSCFGACDGAIVFSNVSGGVPPYSYTLSGLNFNIVNQLSNSFTGLCWGLYSGYVSDANGCMTNNFSWSITQPASPLNIGVNILAPVFCASGYATVQVTGIGGSPPYSGAGLLNLSAGTYTMSVSDVGNCFKDTVIVLTEPPPMTFLYSVNTPILCNGDSAMVMVQAAGGTPPYAGTGTLMLPAGSNLITLTDSNACNLDTSILITQPPQLLALASVLQPIACHGDSAQIEISASGGTPPYANIGTFLQPAGVFSFSVTDSNNCVVADSVAIVSPLPLTLVLSATPDSGTANGTVTAVVSGGSPPYSYAWSNGGSASFLSGLATGWYVATVTDSNGCTARDSVFVDLHYLSSLSGFVETGLRLHPNPTSGKFVLSLARSSSIMHIALMDLSGRMLFEANCRNCEVINGVVQGPAGLYFIRITIDGQTFTMPFLKN